MALALTCLGCGPSVPVFEPIGRDAGLQCGSGTTLTCAATEVCLQGLCYERCSDSNPCGALETCSSEGVCVAGTHDGGRPPDAGPPDPCTAAMCMAPTAACRRGICLACDGSAPGECGGASPICNVGRGTCVPFGPRVCGPCNSDLDCEAPGGPVGRCIERSAPEPTERVCLPTCEGGALCPTGFSCEADVCVPRTGNGSCTGMVAALDDMPCAADSDCAPAGATFTDGLFTGACADPTMTGTPTCHYPCGIAEDCPAGFSGCGADFFCAR